MPTMIDRIAAMARPPAAVARSVLMVASEALPFAKTGGLADVLGALPPALGRLGWDATVVLPRYRGLDAGEIADEFSLTVGGYAAQVTLHRVKLAERAHAILVDVPDLYDRDGIYGSDNIDFWDNPRRFAVLARAALEHAARSGPPPTIVHGHDWHAGLVPVYLKTHYASDPALGAVPTVFTIHNLAFQGNFAADWLPRLDFGWDMLSVDRMEFWGQMSFLKGGIHYADAITTVSPTYAKEIQTVDGGFGFDGILRQRREDLTGILNGIDVEQWNASRDPHLPAPFSAGEFVGKHAAKIAVLMQYGLPVDPASLAKPLVGIISRMVEQKGFDLVEQLASTLPTLDAMFVVLGTGDARYEAMFRALAAAHPRQFGVKIGFDEALAHLIEGGADVFLMPSRWEPCGLNQMYSLRYGTVPVVRGVGGLADTVRDYAPGKRGSTGFVFHDYTPEALLATLTRALDVFANRPEWRALQMAGMKLDLSWDRSAREYVKIYENVLNRRPGPAARGQEPTAGNP
jgi:starch synthase